MGAGSGEEVSSDVIRYYRSLSPDVLQRLKGSGLSDQRVGLINSLLAGSKASEKDLEKQFAESRSVSDVQAAKKIQSQPSQQQTPQSTTKDLGGGRVGTFQDGKLIGVQDKLAGTSRLPTSAESLAYNSAKKAIPQGTYNPSTKIYTSPSGVKQSMATAPEGSIITNVQQQKQSISNLSTSEAKTQLQNQINQNIIKSEYQRYNSLGYGQVNSMLLAEESARRGGVSFTPEAAEKIIRQRTLDKSNGKSDVLSRLRSRVSVGMETGDFSSDSDVNDFNKGFKKTEAGQREIRNEAYISATEGVVKKTRLSISDAIKAVLGNVKDAWKNRGIRTVSAEEILKPIEYTGKASEEKLVVLTDKGEIRKKGAFESEEFLRASTKDIGKVLTREEAAKELAKIYGTTEYENLATEAAYYKISEYIQKKLTPKYQAKLDSGELTQEQANELFKQEVKKEYDKKIKSVEKYFIEREKLELGERTGKKVAEITPEVIEAAGLIALSTTPAGAAAAGAYIAGKGTKEVTEAALNKKLTVKERIVKATSGAVGIITGAVGVNAASKIAEKEIQNAAMVNRLNKLNEQEIKFVGLNIQGEKGSSIAVLKATQKIPGLKTEYEVAGFIKRSGNNAYFVPYGKGTATTTGLIYQTPEKELGILAQSRSRFISRGVSKPINEQVSKVLSQDISVDLINTGAVYEKGTLKVGRSINFPTGSIEKEPNKATEKFIQDLLSNTKIGNKIDVNVLEETNILRINEDVFNQLPPKAKNILGKENANRLYFSQSQDKKVKGIIKAIDSKNAYTVSEYTVTPSDNIYQEALDQFKRQELEKDFVNQLNSINRQHTESFQNIIKKSESRTKEIVETSAVAAEKIKPGVEQVKVMQPNVKNIQRSEGLFDMKQEQDFMQLQKINQKQVAKTNQQQRYKQILKTQSAARQLQQPTQEQNSKQMQNLKSIQRQTQKQTEKQINDILRSPRNKPPQKNIFETPKIKPGFFKLPERKDKDKSMIKKMLTRKPKKLKTKGYTATIENAIFQGRPVKISEQDYEELIKTTFSGLESRPVIEIDYSL